ncbi:hypothetical protein LPO01_05930 [Ligilactobacillus pobuzihii]|nr:hypothetical protein LPO01_05930 [Ligilactobacillus pobuzihii]
MVGDFHLVSLVVLDFVEIRLDKTTFLSNKSIMWFILPFVVITKYYGTLIEINKLKNYFK